MSLWWQKPLLALFVFFAVSTALIDASDNYTVNHGANSNITAHATCGRVANNSATGASVYVPTQTSPEWQSFRTNPPAGVSITSCACTGQVVNGKCYERGSAGQSCATVCTNRGKTCNQTWTRDLDTGSSDSANHCRQVWTRFGITAPRPLILGFTRNEIGCTTTGFGMSGPTIATCAASQTNAARICGCQ